MTKKRYIIGFELKYLEEISVTAKSKVEAKNKAFEKLMKKLKKSMFNIDVTNEEEVF